MINIKSTSRILAILLCLTMAMCLLPVFAFAEGEYVPKTVVLERTAVDEAGNYFAVPEDVKIYVGDTVKFGSGSITADGVTGSLINVSPSGGWDGYFQPSQDQGYVCTEAGEVSLYGFALWDNSIPDTVYITATELITFEVLDPSESEEEEEPGEEGYVYEPKTVALEIASTVDGFPVLRVPVGVVVYVGDTLQFPNLTADVGAADPDYSVTINGISPTESWNENFDPSASFTVTEAKSYNFKYLSSWQNGGNWGFVSLSDFNKYTFADGIVVLPAPTEAPAEYTYVPKVVTLETTGKYINGWPELKVPDGVTLYVGDSLYVPKYNSTYSCGIEGHTGHYATARYYTDGWWYGDGNQFDSFNSNYLLTKAGDSHLMCVGGNCLDDDWKWQGGKETVINFNVKAAPKSEAEICTHAHSEIRNAAEASCADGYTGDTYCTDCGIRLLTGSAIPAIVGAEHGATEVRNASAATCGADGYTGDVCCTVCQQVLEAGQVIPATGLHTPEVRDAVEVTESEDGYTGDTYCSVCDTLLSKGEVIPFSRDTAMIGDTIYESLFAALDDAESGDTVVLLKNTSETYCEVQPGVTLDLNGHNITARTILVFGSMIDSQGSGKLLVAKDHLTYHGAESSMALNADCGSVLPVWNEDSYSLCAVSSIRQWWINGLGDEANGPKYMFQPVSDDLSAILDTDSGIKMVIQIDYSADKINYQRLTFEIGQPLVDKFLVNPTANGISVVLTGTDGIVAIKACAYLEAECGFKIVAAQKTTSI